MKAPRKRVLFIANIPAPYRVDFYNQLGDYVDLTVVFEARSALGITFDWNLETATGFRAMFLSDGPIRERRVNLRILRHLKKGAYDEIVVTSYYCLTEALAILFMKLRGIDYFFETDGGTTVANESILRRAVKWLLISGAKGYLSPSRRADAYLVAYGAVEDRITRYQFTSVSAAELARNKRDLCDRKVVRSRLDIHDELLVLGIGQFIPRKGFTTLIEASRSLPMAARVLIIGGEPTSQCVSLSQHAGSDRVRFMGFQSRETLRTYLLAADIFVLPTRYDVWGLVVSEAMASGNAVVTTRQCGAGVELIEHGVNGFLYEAGDVHALEAILAELAMDGDLRETCAARALETSEQRTMERMVAAHCRALGVS